MRFSLKLLSGCQIFLTAKPLVVQKVTDGCNLSILQIGDTAK